MALLVLYTLAVYGGAAAAFLWLARRFVAPLSRRAGLFLAVAPLLFTGKAMLTGGIYAPIDIPYDAPPFLSYRDELRVGKTQNSLIVDIPSQMLPWRAAVREAAANGRLPLWNRFLLGGEPLLGVAQPAVFLPGTWLGFLLPLAQAWTFDMTLRFFLAALCAALFFIGTGASEIAALLGGLGWAFSGFLVFFVGYPVTASVTPFPLLLLALWRLARGGGLSASALMAAALVLMAVAGHPETLLFSVTAASLFFAWQLFWARPDRRLPAVLWSLAAGALAFGLSAIALLPFLEAMPQTRQHLFRKVFYAFQDRSDALLDSLRLAICDVVPYAFGALGHSRIQQRFWVPLGYVGAALFPLIVAGLLTSGRRRWCWLTLGAFGLALSVRLWGITDLLARAPGFDIAVLEYFGFAAVFAAIGLAVEGIDGLRAGRGIRVFLAASVAVLGAIVLIGAWRQSVLFSLDMTPEYLRSRVLAQVVPILLGAVLVFLAARRRNRIGAGVAAAILVLFAGQRWIEEAGAYPTIPARAFYPPLPVLDPIPRDEPVRMAGLDWDLMPNTSALYGLEDVRGYEPMIFAPLADTMQLWALQLPAFFNKVTQPDSPFLAFLNVRYVLTSSERLVPKDWRLRAEVRGSRLYENPRALPRVFVPRHLVWTELVGLHMRIMQTIGDYARDGVAGEARSGRLHWEDNGPADVRIDSYVADRLRLTTDAASETLIGTSIPNWRGWKVKIDGEPARVLWFNRAFVSFRAPPGRHRVELRYLPDGFVYGAALTGVSAVACAVVAALARRRRAALRKARPRFPQCSSNSWPTVFVTKICFR